MCNRACNTPKRVSVDRSASPGMHAWIRAICCFALSCGCFAPITAHAMMPANLCFQAPSSRPQHPPRLILTIITIILIACAVLVCNQLQTSTSQQHIQTAVAEPDLQAAGPFRSPAFVITIASAHRPGNISYLRSTVHSLYCGLNTSGEPSTWPSVLVLNTEIPAKQHAGIQDLMKDDGASLYFQQGLRVLNMTSLHSQLHTADYVLQLVGRATMALKASISHKVRWAE